MLAEKKCCMDGCKDIVEFSCNCEENSFVCQKHFISHMLQPKKHSPISLFVEMKDDLKFKIIEGNNARCKQLLEIKSQLSMISSEIINYIASQCEITSAKIVKELEFYNNLAASLKNDKKID